MSDTMTDRLRRAAVGAYEGCTERHGQECVEKGYPGEREAIDRALKYREIVEAARRHCADPWDNDVRLKLRALLPEPDGRES